MKTTQESKLNSLTTLVLNKFCQCNYCFV